MKKSVAALLMLTLCLGAQPLRAQVADSVVHSPTKAWLLSAALPGLGQAYNHRYWKIPILYGGFAAFSYFIYSNNFRYQTYKNAYDARYSLARLNPEDANYEADKAKWEAKLPSQFATTPIDRLQHYKNLYRRDRDFFIIMTTLFYIVNMVDAAVDAHFFTYDISNDLSLNFQPYVLNEGYALSSSSLSLPQAKPTTVGLNLSLTF